MEISDRTVSAPRMPMILNATGKNEKDNVIASEELCMDIEEMKEFFYTTGRIDIDNGDSKKDLWA
ncbi:MAG TPA: hypothetical protein VF857_00290 [Spirochaetota bacterium]